MNTKLRSHLKYTIKAAKKEYAYKLLASIMIRATLLVIPLLFARVINDVTSGNYKAAIILCAILILVAALYRIFEALNQDSYYALYNKINYEYSRIGLEKTNDNSMFSLSRFDVGEYNNLLTTDIDLISIYFGTLVIRVVQMIEFVFVFMYFFMLNFNIFVVAVIISLIMLIVSLKGKKLQELNEKSKKEYDNMNNAVFEYYSGIKEVKSFNIFNKIFDVTSKSVKDYLRAFKKYNVAFYNKNSLVLFFFELFRMLSVIYGIYLCSSGNMAVGSLLIIYNYYQKIIDNFSTILLISVETRSVKVSLNRFNRLLEYSKKRKKIEHKNYKIKGNIEFQNILYGYKKHPTMKNVSFTIPAKSITVLTGNDEYAQNGVFDLLLKLNRQHVGKILIDGINIKTINDDDYFKMISLSRRPSYFFNVSIMENLNMIESDSSIVIDICKGVGIHDQIMELENGYDTIIKPTTQLSESFKELLSIARMLLKNSKILLFDDTISKLDKVEQKKIIKLLVSLKKNHTIIVIGNDLNLLKKADKIIEL